MIWLHPCWDGDQWKTTDSSIKGYVKIHLLPQLRNWKMLFLTLSECFIPHRHWYNQHWTIHGIWFFLISCLTKISHIFCTLLITFCVGERNLLTSLTSHYTSKHTTRGKNNPVFSTLLSYSGTGDTTAPDIWACMSRAHEFSKNQAFSSKF